MSTVKSSAGIAKRAASAGKGIAVFYPAKFDPAGTLPSFALVNPLEETGRLPAGWQIKPKFYREGQKACVKIDVPRGSDLYGSGEVTGPLRRNGKKIELWNSDNWKYEKHHGARLYQSHPWVMCVRKDGTAFGVIADTTWKSELDLSHGILFRSEGPAFRVIVIERDSPREMMTALAGLTGTIQLPPKWVLGFQQCRWSYYPAKRVKEIADGFRKRKLPCDVIWMDIHYMDAYKVFTFSPKHFPNPKGTNDYLHKKGFKSVWMIDPGVKKEAGYSVYESGSAQEVWVKARNGKEFNGNVWPGPCAFPDFTRPDVRQWWAKLYKKFMATGIDGVWNDMNEPAVFNGPDSTMPVDNRHGGEAGLPKGPHLRYHNVYGLLMTMATREGIMRVNPGKRPFVLTRSNHLGGHRYAATWTGDNASTWDHLKLSIPMSLTLGLSGQPFNGPDIGGFALNATPELFGHWIAVGALYPFSRAHSAQGTNNHEPWEFGKKIEKVARIALSRRYRLLPYLYTLFRESSVNGMPVMRPVFFADPKDLNLRKEEQAFLLGSDLLVIPKWAKRPALPKGTWRTLSLVGEDSVKDPYQPNLKIRGGAIVPLGKVIQNTTEKSLDPLTLLVCLDKSGKAEGVLYEDREDGFAYKKGDYLLTTFTAVKQGRRVLVMISGTEGRMARPERQINIELILNGRVIKAVGTESSPTVAEIKL